CIQIPPTGYAQDRPVILFKGSDPLIGVLLQLDDVIRLPRLVEERLERPVESEQHEPSLAGHRLDPVRVRVSGGIGTEQDLDRIVRSGSRMGVRADRRKWLV